MAHKKYSIHLAMLLHRGMRLLSVEVYIDTGIEWDLRGYDNYSTT